MEATAQVSVCNVTIQHMHSNLSHAWVSKWINGVLSWCQQHTSPWLAAPFEANLLHCPSSGFPPLLNIWLMLPQSKSGSLRQTTDIQINVRMLESPADGTALQQSNELTIIPRLVFFIYINRGCADTRQIKTVQIFLFLLWSQTSITPVKFLN